MPALLISTLTLSSPCGPLSRVRDQLLEGSPVVVLFFNHYANTAPSVLSLRHFCTICKSHSLTSRVHPLLRVQDINFTLIQRGSAELLWPASHFFGLCKDVFAWPMPHYVNMWGKSQTWNAHINKLTHLWTKHQTNSVWCTRKKCSNNVYLIKLVNV